MTDPRGPGGEPRRASVKVDRFAIFQLRRERKLNANAAYLLVCLVLLADWRDPGFGWQGTFTGLHEDTGLTRRAISREFDVLAEQGCINIVKPFTGGHDVEGLVFVAVYEQLVKLYPGQLASRQSARDSAPVSRPIRAGFAPVSRGAARYRASDQEERDDSGNRHRGKEVVQPQRTRAGADEPMKATREEEQATRAREKTKDEFDVDIERFRISKPDVSS